MKRSKATYIKQSNKTKQRNSTCTFIVIQIFSVVFESLGKVVAWFPVGNPHYTEISKNPSCSNIQWLRSTTTTNFSETYLDKLHAVDIFWLCAQVSPMKAAQFKFTTFPLVLHIPQPDLFIFFTIHLTYHILLFVFYLSVFN